jgi:small GTP-binding protein
MPMITKMKVGLIGATGVGKSSVAARYVHSIFNESYRTTIGVKIETVEVERHGRTVQLVIWDLSGEDEFQTVQTSYLAGSACFLLVVDGTRRTTLDTGLMLARRVRETASSTPFVVVVNKVDLVASWEIEPADLRALEELAYGVVHTSARTGEGVEHAFELVVDAALERLDPTRVAAWT